MISFSHLAKQEKALWLPRLFDLLYDNMHIIAPSGLSYEQQKQDWLSQVSPALDKAPRQILSCFADDELAGYVQYYIRGDLLMVEELQLKRKFHSTLVFYRFCKYFLGLIPGEVVRVEAYAEKRNLRSQALMEKLDMKPMEEEGSPFIHFGGSWDALKKRFTHR